MCRNCLPIILGGLTSPILATYGDYLLGLLSPGCLRVVPLSFLAVLPILSLQGLGIDCLLELLSPGCVVPPSFLAVLPHLSLH
ncbi:unnamed protein product [Nezara viridula]|uniref:Uncharacterized protein n=1 Tax=Nezara viridula TaxID=85310 RepID=A0A9P0E7H6_NEZVI|nr:unnamed protein product [Nezara viridula]